MITIGMVFNMLAISMIMILNTVSFGFTLRVHRFFNISQGAFFIFSFMTVWFLEELYGNFFIILSIVPFLLAAGSTILERYIFRKVEGNIGRTVIVSLALMVIIQQLMWLFYTRTSVNIPEPIGNIVFFGGVVSYYHLLVILISLLACTGLFVLITRTSLGRQIVAVADSVETAEYYGINTDKILYLSFAVFIYCTYLAGALAAPLYARDYLGGVEVLITVMLIAFVGGHRSLRGIFVIGITMYMARFILAIFLPPLVAVFITYLILFPMIYFFPDGIFKKGIL